jgi:tetratricopeptide (TPR) repeat protein
MTAEKRSQRRWSAERDAEGLLEKRTVHATELVAGIRAVNPTGLGLPSSVERKRYALKSRLQSRLILEFFADLDIDEVAGETGVIGLRYRPEGRDACHAVLAELADDARSKVQFHLDTREAVALRSGITAPSRPVLADATDLVWQGQQALGDYDYDKARHCFEVALTESEEDDDTAAVALLEFLVDHLAAWRDALDVESRLSADQLTPQVRTFLALAAALSGDSKACCRVAKDINSPRLAVAFSALANQALLKSDCVEAARFLTMARQFDPTAPEVASVDTELARKKAVQREPAERELHALVSWAPEGVVEEKVRALLERWPESTLGRCVLRELEAKRRAVKAISLAQQAQEAYDALNDARSIALWTEALHYGAVGVEEKIAAASARLERRGREHRIDAVVAALIDSPGEASLGQYQMLESGERQRVRQLRRDEVLEWLEVLRSTSPEREWPLDVAAVLALRYARITGLDAPALLARLHPHEERVRRLEIGGSLLSAAEAQVLAVSRHQALEQLALAREALAIGRLNDAINWAQPHEGSTDDEVRDEAKRISHGVGAHRERQRRREHFASLLRDGRVFDALNVIREADADEGEDRLVWAARRKDVSLRLRQQLRVEVCSTPDELAAVDFGCWFPRIGRGYALDESGEHYYWVTGLGRHLFVRKICLRQDRVVQMVALTTPEALDFPEGQIDGASLWVSNETGVTIQLSTETWDVLRWYGTTHVAESEYADGAVLVPGGRFLWVNVRSRVDCEPVLRIIELDCGRVHRELESEGLIMSLVTAPAGARVTLSTSRRNSCIFKGGGACETALPMRVLDLAVGPAGAGLLAVAPSMTGDEDRLRVLYFPTGGGAPELIDELDDASRDLAVFVATSLEDRTSFVVYCNVRSDECSIVSYAVEGGRVKRRWLMKIPARYLLAQDLHARRASLVIPSRGGLLSVALNGNPPRGIDLAEEEDGVRIPRLPGPGPTCLSTVDPRLLEVVLNIRRSPTMAAGRQALTAVLEQHEYRPEELAFLARQFRGWRMPVEASDVASFASRQFASHPAVKIDAAEAAGERGDWQSALDALLTISGTELNPDARGHWRHQLGLALYQLGRLAEARDVFAQMSQTEVSACDVEGWTEWLDALLGKGGAEDSATMLATLIVQADDALATGQNDRALKLLDAPLVWRSLDAQLGARLATAALEAESQCFDRLRTRLLFAAFLRNLSRSQTSEVPLGHLAWSLERIEAVAARVTQWLETCGPNDDVVASGVEETKPSRSRTCPRCGGPLPQHLAALSRADNSTEVCSRCGDEEAAGQMGGRLTALASTTVAPRGLLPEWRRYCESNPPMRTDAVTTAPTGVQVRSGGEIP